MYIIGHRGAGGLAPENTTKSIKAGIANHANAVEFDVRLTKDEKLILCHDDSLLRICGDPRMIKDLSLVQIKNIAKKHKIEIATIEEAIKAAAKTDLVIEGKSDGWAKPLAKVLKKYHGPKPKVISYNHRELFRFSELFKGAETYAISDNHSIELITSSRKLGFTGVSLYAPLYNPFVYRYMSKNNIKMISSPINHKWRIRLFHFFYPKVMITTDYPNIIKNSQ